MTIPACLLTAGAKLGNSRLWDLGRPHAIWGTSLIRLVAFPAILLFVLADGWYLIIKNLVESF
jgi:hypothetical protein